MRKTQKHIFRLSLACLILSAGLCTAQDKKLGLQTVCIDAGHGGRDPGCISSDGSKAREKDMALSIATELSSMIRKGYPQMKVIMTRSNDTFVELGERAAIANRNNADLFISIHINAMDIRKNPKAASVAGASVHTLGQSKTGKDLVSFNMDVCKRENSVILLESDHSTKYQGFDPNDPESYIFFNLMQNANLGQSLSFAESVSGELSSGPLKGSRGISQDPFYVLWKTTMPAVLIECGFISNKADLAVLKTEDGRKKIASGIYRAFGNFKKQYDESLNITSGEVPAARDNEQTAKVAGDNAASAGVTSPAEKVLKTMYGTQVLATSKRMSLSDPFFKGRPVTEVKYGNIYKYMVDASTDRAQAMRTFGELKKVFKGCFFVEFEE